MGLRKEAVAFFGLAIFCWCFTKESQARPSGDRGPVNPPTTSRSHNTKQEEKRKFDCLCTEEYYPVCDRNGVMYANLCRFNCAKQADALTKCENITISTKKVC